MPQKELIVGGAGTGKTTLLLKMVDHLFPQHTVLYLTYTEQNFNSFRSSVLKRIGYIPSNLTIMTWFSFLLVHGVRPYPAKNFTHRIDRILFKNKSEMRKGVKRGCERYYCPFQDKPGTILSNRLSDLADLCNQQWDNDVIERICSIFDVILVDEGQDFAGYDYDLLLGMMKACKQMVIVGDPRQQTYRTNKEHYKVKYHDIFSYFRSNSKFQIDEESLSITYRCSNEIINLANQLFPKRLFPKCSIIHADQHTNRTGHVKYMCEKEFLRQTNINRKQFTILRYNKRVHVPDGYRVMNMGDSKGLTLNNVVIYPTDGMKRWIRFHDDQLSDQTRAKFYVAITRTSGDLIIVM